MMEEEKSEGAGLPLQDISAGTDSEASASLTRYSERFKFIRENGSYSPVLEGRFRNNLHFTVGFLELANAGDFAANVWNDVPVPVYAIVFMAFGGTVAGVMSVFAFRDARYAWRNVRFLRNQRRQLNEARAQRLARRETTQDIEVLLELNFRELGSESINRFGMDVLMGVGAVLICIGTYMAIGGANRKVWEASNILSGYLGNAPIALYGLVNAVWAIFLATNTQAHVRATRAALSGSKALRLVERRGRKLKLYCAINGTITILGGVGSMITATRWWGYTILAPVIVLSFVCNALWRTNIGYSHDDIRGMPGISAEKLAGLLCFADEAKTKMKHDKHAATDQLMQKATSKAEALELVENCGLSEAFCANVLADSNLRDALGVSDVEMVDISLAEIASLPSDFDGPLLRAVHACISEAGARRFAHLERFTAELLGIYLHQVQHK